MDNIFLLLKKILVISNLFFIYRFFFIKFKKQILKLHFLCGTAIEELVGPQVFTDFHVIGKLGCDLPMVMIYITGQDMSAAAPTVAVHVVCQLARTSTCSATCAKETEKSLL